MQRVLSPWAFPVFYLVLLSSQGCCSIHRYWFKRIQKSYATGVDDVSWGIALVFIDKQFESHWCSSYPNLNHIFLFIRIVFHLIKVKVKNQHVNMTPYLKNKQTKKLWEEVWNLETELIIFLWPSKRAVPSRPNCKTVALDQKWVAVMKDRKAHQVVVLTKAPILLKAAFNSLKLGLD